jgi:amino acid transporter
MGKPIAIQTYSVYSMARFTKHCTAEEIENASTVIPTSMLASVLLNGILGFSMVIALLFCLGDITKALGTETHYPYIEVYRQATNSNAGATAMVCYFESLQFAYVANCERLPSSLLL